MTPEEKRALLKRQMLKEAMERESGPQGSMTEAPIPDDMSGQKMRGDFSIDLPPASSFLDKEAYGAFFRRMGDNIPLAGSGGRALGERARAAASPGDYERNLERFRNQGEAQKAADFETYPRASRAGSIIGSLGLATPFKGSGAPREALRIGTEGMKGMAGSAARVGEQVSVSAADAQMRGESPGKAGAFAGGMSAIPEALRIKTVNRTLLGVPEQVQSHYLKNRAGVNSARELPDLAEQIYQGRENLGDLVSEGSGEAYDMLRASGYEMPLKDIQNDIRGAMTKIREGGAYDKKSLSLLQTLEGLEDAVTRDARLAPQVAERLDEIKRTLNDLQSTVNSAGVGGRNRLPPDDMAEYDRTLEEVADMPQEYRKVPAHQVKSLIAQTNEQAKAYKSSIGEAKGTEYNLGAVRDSTRGMNERLKDNVPGYRAHMDDLAQKTRAFKEVAGRFKDETATKNAVRRMMLGKDPEGIKALRDFDAAGGSNYAQEIQDGFVKEQFGRDRTRGSARTNLGALIGLGIGAVASKGDPLVSSVLGAAGGAAGRATDVYAGRAAKALLDLSQTPYLGRMGELLNKAARRGPQVVLAVHRWGLQNDPSYAEKISALTNPDGAENQP